MQSVAVALAARALGAADDLVGKGAREAATPAAAAEEAEAIFTSLADDAAVRSVVTGEKGVAAGLGDGILIDASTVSPQTTADVSEAVRGRMLASPILGSPTAVVTGEAAYLIEGPRELSDRLAPAYDVLAQFGHRFYADEDARVATTLKLLSNYLLMSGIATLAETVATAQGGRAARRADPRLPRPAAARRARAAQPTRRHRLGRPPRLVLDDARGEGRPASRGSRPLARRAAVARRCREAALRGGCGAGMGGRRHRRSSSCSEDTRKVHSTTIQPSQWESR